MMMMMMWMTTVIVLGVWLTGVTSKPQNDTSRPQIVTSPECRNLTGNFIMSKTVFNGEVHGIILMMQCIFPNGQRSSTRVMAQLNRTGNLQTKDHPWHVHVNRVGLDANNSLDSRCNSAGPHYNPFNLTVENERYKQECGPTKQQHCELGDQSSKLGTIKMGFENYLVGTDLNLPLNGPHSVMGRSVVVHAENGGTSRIGCATIKPVNPVFALFYNNFCIKCTCCTPATNSTKFCLPCQE